MNIKHRMPKARQAAVGRKEGRIAELSTRLAGQIIEFAQIQELEQGAHLAEQKLAELLKVSRTPIRQALQLLETMSVVESKPNRGFFLTRHAEDLQTISLSTNEAEEDPLYFRIAEDRLLGLLDSRVTESELIRRYSISRSRLIRLMAQMTKEGWLERLPGQGWEFLPTLSSSKAYADSYAFRILIEPAALRSPDYVIDPVAFGRIRVQQQAMLDGGIFRYTSAQTFQTNCHFHETIVRASQNSFFLDGIQRINRLRRLMEYRLHKDRKRLIHECNEHLQLLDLIESGNRDAAARFLEEHLQSALKSKAESKDMLHAPE